MTHLNSNGETKRLLPSSSIGEDTGWSPGESTPHVGTPGTRYRNAEGSTARRLADALANVDLFENFDEAVRRSVASLCRPRRYSEGQTVVAWQENSDDVFFVLEGALRATLYSHQGREVAFDDLQPGDMFGELSAIDSRSRSTAVIVTDDCLLAVLGASAFRVMLQSHPAVAMRVLQHVAQLSRRLCDRIVDFTTLDVRQRVQGEVLRLARDNRSEGARVVVDSFPTHAELASRISTHREAVTRELNELDRSGLISRGPGRLVVHDLTAFEHYVVRNRTD